MNMQYKEEVMYNIKMNKNIILKPRNVKQIRYLDALREPKKSIVISVGPAGSGKTLLSTHIGVEKLNNNEIKKIVLTRPMISVDEEIGIMPGGIIDKMNPWIMPFQDVLLQYYHKATIEKLFKENIIEICPLATMRGRSFDNSWIICDEAQNTTPKQMMMLLTRIGKNSKVVVSGDLQQFDNGYECNGLIDFINRIDKQKDLDEWVEIIEFNDNDVVRNKVIKEILKLYNK